VGALKLTYKFPQQNGLIHYIDSETLIFAGFKGAAVFVFAKNPETQTCYPHIDKNRDG